MKTLFALTMMLVISTSAIAQNQSNGLVNPSIFNPTGQQFTSGFPFAPEIFRFRPGLVTQADDFGTPSDPFSFFDARWFSIGRLQTSEAQTVYGLRFQLPFRAVTFGYQDIEDNNPRIQWIYEEEGIGDLEFRVADSFTSTNSDLVATMRSDTGTVFAINNSSAFDDAKVGILDVNFDKALEIVMEFNGENPTYGVDVLNGANGKENYGYNARILGTADENFGYNSIIEGNAENNYGYNTEILGEAGLNWGLRAFVFGNASTRYGVDAIAQGEGNLNFGVKGLALGATTNFGIYGSVPNTGGFSNNPGDFAGFFDGDLGTTSVGLFVPSDSRLKKRIKDMEFAHKDLLKLKPKVYEYIKSDKINLSQGQQFGFIAQELEEVFPELIKEVKKPVFDKDGNITEYFEYKSVNYIPLIPVLTASLQELTKEVENLKATNNSYLVYSDRLSSEEQKRLESMAYKLEQNYPNPFSGKSIIEYSLPYNEKGASIMVFDLTGGLLKTFKLSDKSGQILINSEDFKPGMYLYSLVVRNDEIMTKKMIVR